MASVISCEKVFMGGDELLIW